jgi:hypothetical protein
MGSALTNSIAPVSNNSRSREGAIDQLNRHLNTIWCCGSVFNIEPILPHNTGIGNFLVVVGRYVIAILPT